MEIINLATIAEIVVASVALTAMIIYFFRIKDDRTKKLINLGRR